MGAAELYADVGLGHMAGSALVESAAKVGPESPPGRTFEVARGPHATVEVGYTIGRTSVFASHASSLATGRDEGVNFVGVKHRFSVKVR